jgi:seryl-tRNA synthetase
VIDIKVLADDPDRVKASQVARGDDPALVDQVIDADAKRRAALTEFEQLRARQKSMGKEVAAAQGEAKQVLLAETKSIAAKVKELQATSDAAVAERDALLMSIGNVIVDGVPAGGEEDYVLRETVGTPRDFAAEGFEPRDHLTLGESLGAIDMERGAKVAGARFYFLTGVGARLELALLQMAIAQAVLRRVLSP